MKIQQGGEKLNSEFEVLKKKKKVLEMKNSNRKQH